MNQSDSESEESQTEKLRSRATQTGELSDSSESESEEPVQAAVSVKASEAEGSLQGTSGEFVREAGTETREASTDREEMNAGKAAISFDKLKGRSNFDEWKISAKSYLIIKKLWVVVSDVVDDDEKNERAVGEITLMVEPSLYSYIPTEYGSAKEVWDKLADTFEDKGVARKVTILNVLVSFKLANFENMERYINEILLYWEKSKQAGFKIEEAVIASLMLGGLPEEYRAMILGIENSGKELTIDYVKTVLLQGIPENGLVWKGEGERALAAACRKGGARKRRCFICDSELHLAISCPNRERKCYVCGDLSHMAKSCPNAADKKTSGCAESKKNEEKERVLFVHELDKVM